MKLGIVVIVMVGAALAAGYWLGTRGQPVQQAAAPAAGASAVNGERRVLYYRNPMGLPDTSPVPKKDPMGMDYVPVYEGDAPQNLPPGAVRIAPDKVQLLGVRTEPAQRRRLERTVHAVGIIQPNERGLYKVAPRFEGWIEKLMVNTTGQAVSRGQVLMEVYSPELVAAQEEYLIALRAEGELKDRLSESALRRLRNWEISERELERLRQTGKPQRVVAYRSLANGVVLAKPSIEGMRFMPGDVLYEIADLSSVWLLAEVAEQDLGLVRVGQGAKVAIASYPGREFAGKVVFVYPTLESGTRTARVRVEMPNPGGLLKPSMYADARLGAESTGPALAVPDSAVLDSGNRQLVLVDRGQGVFEPRDVKLGMRADGYIEVRDGLTAGEQVVVRANFLIDAESNLKSALASFGGHGGHGGAAKPPAGSSGAAQAPATPGAPTHAAKGTVDTVDATRGTVEITHGPIATLGWPGMTMEFKAKDKALLAGLKKGDTVDFELAQSKPGEFVIERIAPAGGAPAAAPAGHGAHGG